MATVTVLVIAATVVFVGFFQQSPAERAADLFRQARTSLRHGDREQAEQLSREAAETDRALTAAWKLAAECAVARKDYTRAVLDLSQIEMTDININDWLESRYLAADILHNRAFRLRDAEGTYLEILDVRPDDVTANDGYARLLGLCGRRQEAIPHILRLIRAGQDTDLLVLLARESGLLSNPEVLDSALEAVPDDPNPLLGQAAAAAGAQDHQLALQKLRAASSLPGLPNNFHGLLGQQLLANNLQVDLHEWWKAVPSTPQSYETWLVIAELAGQAGDHEGALRCYWEAVRRRPESLQAVSQLASKLTIVGNSEDAAVFQERVRLLNELRDAQQLAIMSAQRPTIDNMITLIKAYINVGRFWEALAWAGIAQQSDPENLQLIETLKSLNNVVSELPLQQTADSHNPALLRNLSHYPVPHPEKVNDRLTSDRISSDIVFRRQSVEIGFDFTYFSGSQTPTRRMFEFSGGGIAAVDFDGDGYTDLFCTQGRPWDASRDEATGYQDQLFRNHSGRRFASVTTDAFTEADTGFGQGVSAGDFNNDGFADIYVANARSNKLWVNNGDGTFTQNPSPTSLDENAWTTSCLIADLNHDEYPDLYDVNYLAADDVFDRLCVEEHGDTIMCAPYDFAAARDRVFLSRGDGTFSDSSDEFLVPPADGKGLGILAMRSTDKGLSLFIANDTTANFFYVPTNSTPTQLTDTAAISGLAFNGDGKAEACMGIAAADCTQDGRLDLFVTNFLYESNTLYSPVQSELFEDQTRQYGLHEPSLPVLGFGTQFLDANLDGHSELYVVNGFTQDLTKYDTPYQMRPQLFTWTGSGFQLVTTPQPEQWDKIEQVGRPVSRLDWNRDGRPDLAVGLLDSASHILTNESPADHGVTLRLIATASARDAIGTEVTAAIAGRLAYFQLTAGDGYQCTNERTIHIGSSGQKIDRLTVHWPSGRTQIIESIPSSVDSLIVVENRKPVSAP